MTPKTCINEPQHIYRIGTEVINYLITLQSDIDQDVRTGIIELIPIGEIVTLCHRMWCVLKRTERGSSNRPSSVEYLCSKRAKSYTVAISPGSFYVLCHMKRKRPCSMLGMVTKAYSSRVKSMQRSGTKAIRTQIQPSKPKREMTDITSSQNTKRTYGQPSELLFPKRWPLSNRTELKKISYT